MQLHANKDDMHNNRQTIEFNAFTDFPQCIELAVGYTLNA